VGASSGIIVHVADLLPVALGHLEDFGTDFDELAATLLLSQAAGLANRECDRDSQQLPMPCSNLPTTRPRGTAPDLERVRDDL